MVVDATTGHFGVTFAAPQVIPFSADIEQRGVSQLLSAPVVDFRLRRTSMQ